MPSRRSLLRAAALTPLSAALAPVLGLGPGPALAAAASQADFLFVQNARGVAVQDGRLVLTRVNPITVMFSDRPERVAGHLTTRRFVALWNEGPDSFAADPPNATLSFIEDRDLDDVVVVLRDPRLEADTLSYQVETLEGRLPERAGEASLFIDIIGMPLTPISYGNADYWPSWPKSARDPTTRSPGPFPFSALWALNGAGHPAPRETLNSSAFPYAGVARRAYRRAVIW